jgi:hypothetical protein
MTMGAMWRLTKKKLIEHGLHDVVEIFDRHRLTEKERDTLWQGFAGFCLYQLETRRGPFYHGAKHLLQHESPKTSRKRAPRAGR